MYSLKLLLLRKKVGVGSSLLIVWLCAGDGAYGKGVSQPFLYILMWVIWVFSHSPMWRSGLASVWVSFRETCSQYRCRFIVSMGGGKFRRLLCPSLGRDKLVMFYGINSPWGNKGDTWRYKIVNNCDHKCPREAWWELGLFLFIQ